MPPADLPGTIGLSIPKEPLPWRARYGAARRDNRRLPFLVCHETPAIGNETQAEDGAPAADSRQIANSRSSNGFLAEADGSSGPDGWRMAKERSRARYHPVPWGHLIRPDTPTAAIGIALALGCTLALCSRRAASGSRWTGGFLCRSRLLRLRCTCLGFTNGSDEFVAGLFSSAHHTITSSINCRISSLASLPRLPSSCTLLPSSALAR